MILIAGAVLAGRLRTVAHDRALAVLRQDYNGDAKNFQVSFFPTISATGDDLVVYQAGGRDVPVVKVVRFRIDAGLFAFLRGALLGGPQRIRRLGLKGLTIRVPPKSQRPPGGMTKMPRVTQTTFILEEVSADGSRFEVVPNDPSKGALVFDFEQLSLHNVGSGATIFHARIDNPKPHGLVETDGKFGPWNTDDPGSTPISGRYSLRHADLSVFKGIAGFVTSDAVYTGALNRMEVRGTSDTPQFALRYAGNRLPVHVEFVATVNGTDGTTVLHPAKVRLGTSRFDVTGAIARGAILNHKTIELRADSPGSALEDILRLTVKAPRPPMTGTIRFATNVRILPRDTDVLDRLQFDGTLDLNGVKFTSDSVQRAIAGLSHRAEGDPKDHDPHVSAAMHGGFRITDGILGLPDFELQLPGADVRLAGTYALRGGDMDFKGTARLRATVSQMTTGVKRVLLKPVDPLFRHNGAGTVVPIKIGGTRGQPSFSIDIGRALRH